MTDHRETVIEFLDVAVEADTDDEARTSLSFAAVHALLAIRDLLAERLPQVGPPNLADVLAARGVAEEFGVDLDEGDGFDLSTVDRLRESDEWPANWTAMIGKAVRAARKSQRLSAQKLSNRCTELGSPIPRNAIANLENARKTALPVHELVAIAAALDVSPAELLVPLCDPAPRVWALPDEPEGVEHVVDCDGDILSRDPVEGWVSRVYDCSHRWLELLRYHAPLREATPADLARAGLGGAE